MTHAKGSGIAGLVWRDADDRWKVIAVRAKAGIGYHGVVSSIPSSDLPTLSVVSEGDVSISIKH